MTRPEITEYLRLVLHQHLLHTNFNVFHEVSIRQHPSYTPVAYADVWHLDTVALEGQRQDSHNPFAILAFEIKSCRDDFAIDTKWRSYLGRCDRFIFVAPPGVITKNDVADTPAGIWEFAAEENGYAAWHKVVHGKMMSVSLEARFDLMYGCAINRNRRTLQFLLDGERQRMRELGKQWYKDCQR